MNQNRAMQNLMEKETVDFTDFGIEINCLRNFMFPKFQVVGDCVVIADESPQVLEQGIQQAVQAGQGRVGYEASCNEQCINDLFPGHMSLGVGLHIAWLAAYTWGVQLKRILPQSQFCLIVSCNEKIIILRFHKVRKEEVNWLSDNLEDYQQEAVGFFIV